MFITVPSAAVRELKASAVISSLIPDAKFASQLDAT
jgi:hypothetical protein